ncbi:MAG: GAF domain-containing protein [Anaerolineae bacterium]|nr:GAF domain-containing protein [Anaerolineae bacterium]
MSHGQSSTVEPSQQRLNVTRVAVLFLLAIVAMLLLVASVRARQTLLRPFPGVFAEPTSIVMATEDSLWAGYQAGLHWPEQIVAVYSRPVNSPTALWRMMQTYQVGSSVPVRLRDPYDGFERTVRVTLTALPDDAFIDFFLLPNLLGWFYLLVGSWVLWTQRRGEAGRVFAVFCAAVVLVFGLFFDMYTSHQLWWAWVAAVPLAGSAILHLGLVFPERLRFFVKVPWAVWFTYLPGIALAIIGVVTTADWANPIAYFRPWLWGRAWAGMGVLTFAGLMVYHRIFSPSPVIRSQVRIVILGTLLAFGPYVIWTAVFDQFGATFEPWVIFSGMVMFPLSIAYAIPHYRTLDINWVIRRSFLYIILALLLAGGFFALPAAVNRVFDVNLSIYHPVMLIVYALVVAVGFMPLYQVVHKLLRWLVEDARVSREQALHRFGQAVSTARTQTDVLEALGAVLKQTVATDQAVLYLRDVRVGQYIPCPIFGKPVALRFSPDGELAQRMMETPRPLHVSPDSLVQAGLGGDETLVSETGMALFVPVPGQGWLALGPPPPGRRFRTQDLRFFDALMPQIIASLERVRLVTDLEWRTKELETVLMVAQAVGYSVELDDLLELIYTQTGKVLDVTNFYIALHDPEKDVLRFALYIENGERLYPDQEWPSSQGLTGIIVRSGWPIVTNDYRAECEQRGVQPGGKPGRAWMGVPLVAGDRVLGVINVSSFDPNVVYTPEQAKVLRAVADQAAMIIEKTQIYQEIEERARQLEALNDVGGLITSVLDLEEVLQLIMEKAVEITHAEAGSLLLMDEDTGELVFQVTLGPGDKELKNVRLAPGTGIVGQVADEARPIMVADVSKDERWFDGVDEKIDFITRSLLCVPLIARGRVIGVIELINRREGRPFDAGDQNLLMAFAANAAISIENARLFTTTDQALAARVEELSMMQRIDRELNATLDYQRVMDLTLQWALRMTGADIGLLAVTQTLDDGQMGLRFLANHGYPEELFATTAELWPLERGIVGHTVLTGEPTLIRNVREYPNYFPANEEMVAQITAPIRREEQIIGVIALEFSDKTLVDEDALDSVIRLADHAAIAIENARLFAAVRAANDAKTEFVSFVSHELKQPMTSIKGYADLLTKGTAGELSDMQRSFLEVIRNNVGRMDMLVQGLLDISRIEAGRVHLELKAMRIKEVVDEAVMGVREQVDAKSQTLDVNVPEVLPEVWADRTRLIQVLVNLLSNACKYTPQGGSIYVSAGTSNGTASDFVSCTVRDTGIGISEEDKARLFTKYFRAADPAVRSEPGTGLGLVITRSLVQMQGGDIWMESQVGQGSTFTFTIPIAKND